MVQFYMKHVGINISMYIVIPLNVPNGTPTELWHWRCFQQFQQRQRGPDPPPVESLAEVRCLLLFLPLPEIRSY